MTSGVEGSVSVSLGEESDGCGSLTEEVHRSLLRLKLFTEDCRGILNVPNWFTHEDSGV